MISRLLTIVVRPACCLALGLLKNCGSCLGWACGKTIRRGWEELRARSLIVAGTGSKANLVRLLVIGESTDRGFSFSL